MPWLQLRIDTDSQQAPVIEDALLANGAVSVTLQDNADQPILEPELGTTPLWNATQVIGLFDADIDTAKTLDGIAEFTGNSLKGRWEQLEDREWVKEWEQYFEPIDCGHRLWICPSWKPISDPDAVNLLLDPGLAFGTGTHPTTFLCLQWLAEMAANTDTLSKPSTTVLDYGCGSGILGIAALLLGADSMIGTDIDHQALLATADNARRNGIEDNRLQTMLPAKLPEIQADVTCANILAGPLQSLAPELSRLTRPGGFLCLSGLLESQAAELIETYSTDFDFDSPRIHEGWCCLTAVRRHS